MENTGEGATAFVGKALEQWARVLGMCDRARQSLDFWSQTPQIETSLQLKSAERIVGEEIN